MPRVDTHPPSASCGPSPSERMCDCPGCCAEGSYRAPKGRQQLREYFWFCLDHVREYNRAWDYYKGMSASEIEAEMRSDTTWQRPTWPLGQWRLHEECLRQRVWRDQGFPFYQTGDQGFQSGNGSNHHTTPIRTAENAALEVLDLAPGTCFAEIKARYRALAKVYHPDANGGDRAAEEKLKQINQAYTILKASHGP